MGFACAIAMMALIFVVVLLVSRWDAKTAYRMLEHSQQFFGPEGEATSSRSLRNQRKAMGRAAPTKRSYITPLVKKRVAAKQGWRCAVCKGLLDETFDIDHITPLYKGGHPTDESNLQALCKRDHMFKSAVSDRL